MNVQIDLQLIVKLWTYFYELDRNSEEEDIFAQLDAKMDKLIARDLYSKYKRAATEEERNAARIEYLQHVSK